MSTNPSPDPTADTVGITRGADRTLQFSVRGSEFRARRPSRADQAEIYRRFVRKICSAAPAADVVAQDIARAVLNNLDGGALLSEARLEVLLTPRDGAALGERAPSHWLRQVKGLDETTVVATLVTFDEVDPEEFDEVARWVDAALAPAGDTSS
ncbi:MAG: hypothetical protein ABI624_11050 [Casimicrobiaceae bacterium]